MWKLHNLLIAGVAVAAIGSSTVYAQSYPTKPITLVSPKAAGGAADLAARAFAVIAERYIGQPVRVVNKPGGAGIPGIMSVRSAKPDGHMLMAALSPWMLTAPIFKKKNPYGTWDFTYISVLEEQPITFAVRKDSPHKDVKSLLAAINKGGKAIKVGVASKIGLMTMAYHGLAHDLKADRSKLQPVPFKNGPAAARGLLAGDVDFASINLASINAALRSGDARLLMVTTTKRNFAHPSVPTAGENNLPTVNGIALWAGIIGPKGLPKNVLDKWAAVLPKVLADPDYKKLLSKRGAAMVGTLPSKTEGYVRGQQGTFETLKKNLGS
jgi:tripartite-type tricarboxylate transporter receptor subunit TctC